MPSSEYDSIPFRGYMFNAHLGRAGKRTVDLAGALLLILLLLPLMSFIWLLVKLSSEGPVLFLHQRVGRNGKMFACLKFRTMVPDAAAVLERHLRDDEGARLEWASCQKLKNDPRVTRIGAFLRRSSLDELPQFFNVLRGDMSFVGPRPIVPTEMAHYGDQIVQYMSVRPGITGLWQVSGRSDAVYSERVRLDTHYVQNWSIGWDIAILLATVPIVLTQRGSY